MKEDKAVVKSAEIQKKIETEAPISVVEAIAKEPTEISFKDEAKAKLARFVQEETKMVKGRFRNIETPGGAQYVAFKKYKDVPMFSKMMMDGEVYEVPLYIARHINGVDVTAASIGGKVNSCRYPTHGFAFDSNGNMPSSDIGVGGIPVPILRIAKMNARCSFESLEFGAA